MNHEAVIFNPALGLAALCLLSLLLIPVVPLVAGMSAVRAMGPAGTWRTFFLDIAALALGLLAAPLLLSTCAFVGALSPHEIFRSGGPWDLDFRQFIVEWALPLMLSPFELMRLFADGNADPDIARGAILWGVLAAPVVLGPAVTLQTRAGLASSARSLLLLWWAAYTSVYIIAIALWLANKLNFWSFLVLFAATLWVRK